MNDVQATGIGFILCGLTVVAAVLLIGSFAGRWRR